MLSDVVAELVKRYRDERGLRRVDLAARCAALGWPALTEGALGNIETGRRNPDGVRRREVTADEVVILAAALGVPPIALIMPVGRMETVELIPGYPVAVDLARRWFEGGRGRPRGPHACEDVGDVPGGG